MTAAPMVRRDLSGDLEVSPYQGLTPYPESRSQYFFGRDADILRIVDHLNAYPLTVLIGPSGVGKSSVLQAGVISKIRRDNRAVFEQMGVVDSAVAFWANWRDAPEMLLAQAVATAFEEAIGEPNELSRATLDAGSVTAYANEHDVDLLLVLDQFEELFLYHPGTVESFARSLAELIAPGSRARLLISIREDGLAKLKAFERAIPRIFDNTLRLEHLDRAAAGAAIVRPLEVYNRDVPDSEKREVEPALVDLLLDQVRTGRVRVDSSGATAAGGPVPDAGDARFEAPFLQLVLLRLWDEETRRHSRILRASTLAELGGAQEIVRQHLDRVTAQMPPDQIAVMVRAFEHLVTPSGSKIAHYVADLADMTDTSEPEMERVVRQLCQSERLVLREVPGPIDDPEAKPRFEIFHDVLAAAVLDWRRRKIGEVKAAALEDEVRQTNHQLRRTRMVLGGVGVLLLLCVALAVSSLVFWRQSSSARDEANLNAAKADANAAMAEGSGQLLTNPSTALAKALPLWRKNDDPRLETLVRQAYGASGAIMEIRLGSPVVHATYVADDALVAVTRDGWVRRIQLGEGTASTESEVDATPGDSKALVADSAVAGGGRYVLVALNNGDVSVVDLEEEGVQPVEGVTGTGRVRINAVSGAAGDLVAFLNDEHYYVVDVTTAKDVAAYMGPGQGVYDLGADHSGEFLAVLHNHRIEVWDATARTEDDQRKIDSVALPGGDDTDPFRAAFVGVDSDHVLVSGFNAEDDVVMWEWDRTSDAAPKQLQVERDVKTLDRGRLGDLVVIGDRHANVYPASGSKQALQGGASAGVAAAAVSAQDPRLVALADLDGEVTLYELGKGTSSARPLVSFGSHPAPLVDVQFSPRNTALLTAAADGTIRLWRLPERQVAFQARYGQQLMAARYGDRGREIVTVTWDGKVRYIRGAFVDQRDPEDSLSVEDMDLSADGVIVAIVERGHNTPTIQYASSHSGTQDFEAADGTLTRVRWSPTGSPPLLAAGTDKNTFVVWDGDTGKIVAGPTELGSRAAEVKDVEFSGDGRHLVVTSAAGEVTVVSTTDWEVETSWRTAAANAVAVNFDASLVATAADRFLVEVWDTTSTGDPLCVLPEPRGSIDDLAFSQDPDSSRLAGVGAEGVTYIWDPARCGTKRDPFLARMREHSDRLSTVAFDPNDVDVLMSAGEDADVLVYDCQICGLDRKELIEAAETRLMVSVDLGE